MIPFSEVWLPEIVGYCQLVTEKTLWESCVNHSREETSVTDFDELYEQIFDDLDSDDFDENLQDYLPEDELLRNALSAFLQSIRDADVAKEKNQSYACAEILLNSGEWHEVIKAAKNVLIITKRGTRTN